ncbi:hypothetical protein HMPREF1572_01127 [Gardnerella vaginalis JCP7275]|nr:hypothetical protein HMPREF1572_01127 [Gardnerella vaginalis JCP7275]
MAVFCYICIIDETFVTFFGSNSLDLSHSRDICNANDIPCLALRKRLYNAL